MKESSSSFTAAAPSEPPSEGVAARVRAALAIAEGRRPEGRLRRLENLEARFADLQRRGLIEPSGYTLLNGHDALRQHLPPGGAKRSR